MNFVNGRLTIKTMKGFYDFYIQNTEIPIEYIIVF